MRWAQKALIQTHCKYVFSSVKDEKRARSPLSHNPVFRICIYICIFIYTHINAQKLNHWQYNPRGIYRFNSLPRQFIWPSTV